MDVRWQDEMAAIVSGFKEWRLAHPRATLAEIEAALDARWAVARARLVEDAALASAQADVRALPPEARPRCPDCGAVMEARGVEVRRLTTTHEQPVTLRRHRAVCPACGAGLFPPG
jgi:predicted RNA-binding Zn-ribbon protein involved in translation (DUF1610 family)